MIKEIMVHLKEMVLEVTFTWKAIILMKISWKQSNVQD